MPLSPMIPWWVWSQADKHELRNLATHAPKGIYEEIKEDYYRIVYAEGLQEARQAHEAFLKRWAKRCAGVAKSLQEAGDELLTFYRFPKSQWKSIRSTNVIERMNGEFRRRVKTQGSFPTEEAILALLFGLVVSGQVRMRKIDGWRELKRLMAQATVSVA